MSMSEFESPMDGPENDLSNLSIDPAHIPDDFSVEDMVFAQELESLFDFQKEELPPYFAQTLLEPHDPRFQTVAPNLEKITCARVFRRLHLPRRLFRSHNSPWRSLAIPLPRHRSMFVALTTSLLVMILTVACTAPSFAAGMAVLLAGPHSGVVQVHDYPGGITSVEHPHAAGNTDSAPANRTLSLSETQEMLHFPMYWPSPDTMPNNYSLSNIYIYERADQSWADGPIMELDYDYTFPGATPRGSGRIAICEFKPMGRVLQVVKLGSTHELKIDPDGNATALYVDGQWSSIDKSSYQWDNSGRSELIYERDGVIFWIVGNQNDGVTSDVLSNIATSLDIFNASYAMRMGRVINNVMQSQENAPRLLVGDVIYLVNPDNPDGATLKIVEEDDPSQANPPPQMYMRPYRNNVPSSS